jgi:methylmalonyl-CoA/ethylmalonyl-CoA epimerase
MKFDHIGIVVNDLAEGRRHLHAIFGIERWTEVFEDRGIGVLVQFGVGVDGPCYELIAPLGDGAPVSGALRSGKAILNHVAYLVEDLELAADALQDEACVPVIGAKPAVAYHGRRVQFFQSPLRFLIEIIEASGHQHQFLAHPPMRESE